MASFQIIICAFVAFGMYNPSKGESGYGVIVQKGQDPNAVPPEAWYKLYQAGKFDNTGRGYIGGFKTFLCTANPNNMTFGDCSADCSHNHGATYGVCGNTRLGDHNCYCGEPVNKLEDDSMHCQENTPEYVDICTVDCLCNHAATGGVCNWGNKACVCTGQGTNLRNVGCPVDTWHDFTKVVHQKIGHRGLAYVDKPYHWFIAGDIEYPNLPQF